MKRRGGTKTRVPQLPRTKLPLGQLTDSNYFNTGILNNLLSFFRIKTNAMNVIYELNFTALYLSTYETILFAKVKIIIKVGITLVSKVYK
jgi:hypothetical protein